MADILNQNPLAPPTVAPVVQSTAPVPTVAPITPVAPIASPFQVNPAQVYSTTNMITATKAPKVKPDDLLGIRKQINTELGIPGLQSSYQDIFNQLMNAKSISRSQQNAIENLPQALNVIRGEQAQAQNIASQNINALADAGSVAQSALQAAQMEADKRYAVREAEVRMKQQMILDNPGAKIKFGDSVEDAAKKIYKFKKKQAEEAAKAEWESWKKKTDYTDQLDFSSWKKKYGISNGGSKSDDKSIQQFYSDAADLRKEMITSGGATNWANAWGILRAKYPKASIELIDTTLGLNNRNQFDK